MILPVILSGGSGTRLWPLSRRERPKQLLPLLSQRSLLQDTVLRLDALGEECVPPLIICNESHRAEITEQLAEIDRSKATLVFEPEGRNTAPAIAVAALLSEQLKGDENATLLILPADHSIGDANALAASVSKAAAAAGKGLLVTFGVVPSRPETGFGYIWRGDRDGDHFHVRDFVEKPSPERAEEYVASGDYYWNSGMFALRAQTYLTELERLVPEIAFACRQAVEGATCDDDCIELARDAFVACRAESIDYAVMEHTDRAAVVELNAGWSDVGSWESLYDASPQDNESNVVSGDLVQVDSSGNFLYSPNKVIAAIGVENLIVVDSEDALLVMTRGRAQDVKKIVSKLEK